MNDSGGIGFNKFYAVFMVKCGFHQVTLSELLPKMQERERTKGGAKGNDEETETETGVWPREFILAKQRNGPAGDGVKVSVMFRKDLAAFESAARPQR